MRSGQGSHHGGPEAPRTGDAFLTLPEDVLIAVLSLLANDDPRNLIPAMEVDRRWRQLVQQADIWETAVVPLVDRRDRLPPYARNIQMVLHQDYLPRGPSASAGRGGVYRWETLEAQREKNLLHILVSQCEYRPPLHTVTLEVICGGFDRRFTTEVADTIIAMTSLTSLRKMIVLGTQRAQLAISPESMAAIGSMTQLTSLALSNAFLSSGWLVSTYLTALLNLQHLDLFDIATSNDCLRHIAQLTKLTTLMVSNCYHDDEELILGSTPLSVLTSLRHLHTLTIHAWDDDAFKSLGQLTQLRCLSSEIGSVAAGHVSALLALTNLTALNFMDEIGPQFEPDQQPTAPLSRLTCAGGTMQLRHLRTRGPYCTRLNSVCKLSYLTTLESLTLLKPAPDCLTASALSHLAGLTSISITSLEFTEAHLRAFAQLKNLVELVLEDVHLRLLEADGSLGDIIPFPLGALSSLRHLACLKMSNLLANPAEVSSLFCSKSLTAIQLSSVCILERSNTGSLLECLSCARMLQSLDMHGEVCAIRTWHHLSALTRLTSLRFDFCALGIGGSPERHDQVSTLSCLTRLQVLDATNNGMNSFAVLGLAALSSLHTLKLGNNRLGDMPPHTIAQLHLLTRITGLRMLDLSENNLTRSHGPGLAQLTQLQALVLRMNNLGYEGVVELVALSQLRLLDVRGNGIGPRIKVHLPWTKSKRSAQRKQFSTWCKVMIDPDSCGGPSLHWIPTIPAIEVAVV